MSVDGLSKRFGTRTARVRGSQRADRVCDDDPHEGIPDKSRQVRLPALCATQPVPPRAS